MDKTHVLEEDTFTSDNMISIGLQRVFNPIAIIALGIIQFQFGKYDTWSYDLKVQPDSASDLLLMKPYSQYLWVLVYAYLVPLAIYSALPVNTPLFKHARLVYHTIGWSYFETVLLLITREVCVFGSVKYSAPGSKTGHILSLVALICQVVALTITLRVYYNVFRDYMQQQLIGYEILIFRVFGSLFTTFMIVLTLEQIYAEITAYLSVDLSAQQLISCALLQITLVTITWMSCRFQDCIMTLPFLAALIFITQRQFQNTSYALFLEFSTGVLCAITIINFFIVVRDALKYNQNLDLVNFREESNQSIEIY